MAKQTWSDLSATKKRIIYVAGATELVVTSLALRDVVRRPSASVRGPKLAWVASFVVQPFGPIAYFVAGRR